MWHNPQSPGIVAEHMLKNLREILLTEYIGSILIALLALQAAVEFITTVVRTGFWFFNQPHTKSVLGRSSSAPFRWDTLIFDGVKIALYLLTAYGLARWLYPDSATVSLDSDTPSEALGSDQADQS
jgi:hypothetical protein